MTKQTRVVGDCLEVLPMMREARRRIVEYFGGVGFADLYRRLEPLPKKETDTEKAARRFRGRIVYLYRALCWRMTLWKNLELIYGGSSCTRSVRCVRRNRTIQKWKASDYLMLQRIVDGELVFHDLSSKRIGTHMYGLAQDDDGEWWFAAWKKTEDGRELYFTTLHNVSGRSRRKALRKEGKRIKRRKK